MSSRALIRFLPLAALLVLPLGHCDPDPTPDTTPPTVVSTTPTDGAAEVDRATAITATFSEAMDPATISAATFTLAAGATAVAGAVTLDAAGIVATLTPAAPLAWATEYTATVATGAHDLAGNALAADHAWTFTTAEPPWEQVGGQVSQPDAESEDPIVMAIGGPPAVGYRHASFEPRLAWFDDSGAGAWVHELDPTGGNINGSIYGTPGWCNDGSRVWLAYSLAGDAAASDDTFYDRVFVQAWSPSSWTPQNGGDELSTVWDPTLGGANAWEPAIACPAGGDPYVAWVESDVVATPDTPDGLWAARVHAASSDRSEILSRIGDTGTYLTDVRTVGVAADPAGGAVVAQWESDDTDQDLTELYVARWDGTGFTELGGAVVDDWDYNNLCIPSPLVLDGEVYLAYSRANPTDYTKHVYVAYWTGSAWELVGGGPVSAFPEAEHYDSSNPHLIAVEGELWLAWSEDHRSEGSFIFVARWDAGDAEWVFEGRRLNIDDARPADDPTLAYDADRGVVYCAFEESVAGWPQIFVVRREVVR
jgi:hypothetical protein